MEIAEKIDLFSLIVLGLLEHHLNEQRLVLAAGVTGVSRTGIVTSRHGSVDVDVSLIELFVQHMSFHHAAVSKGTSYLQTLYYYLLIPTISKVSCLAVP